MFEDEFTYYCNCCGCEFDVCDCLHPVLSEEDVECPECGCTYDTGYIERYLK